MQKWLLLGLAGGISSVAVLPYYLSILGLQITPFIIATSFIQNFVLFTLLSLLGLKLADKINLNAIPVLDGKVNFSSILKTSVVFGFLTGGIILASSLFLPLPPDTSIPQSAVNGLLASFYGGIAEEITMRLFLVSLLVFIAMKITRAKKFGNKTMWFAIVFASILFGLGHLPATGLLAQITPFIVFRAVVLNGIGGIVFGWLYWKRGLESAMIAHFCADIVLHVLPALIII